MTQHYDGQFIHWVEVTDLTHARAAYIENGALANVRPGSVIIIEVCRTYPERGGIVKVIHECDDVAEANVIGEGAAKTYGATFLPRLIHDPATCQHEDCRWARMSQRERDNLEAFGRDADRIDASPGRYW